jgi:FMN reductase
LYLLLTKNLPFHTGSLKDPMVDTHAGIMELKAKLKAANGILVETPKYHSSLSGVLKDALDLLRFPEFEDKVVGLVKRSHGRRYHNLTKTKRSGN